MVRVFCVIPAYNEEKNISEVVKKVRPLVDRLAVVDDGSQDRTTELASAAGAVVLKHVVNRGQGAALQTGNRWAIREGADVIVHFDADGQFMPEEIASLIAPIKAGRVEAVFGSRFLEKRSNIPWFKKMIIIPLARIFNLIFLGVNFTDPQSGFRALSRRAAEATEIKNDGMAHNSEILSKICRSGLSVEEVPMTVIYHDFGQRLGGGFKIIKDLLLSKILS